MANEIGRNVQRFFDKVEESITENKRCKLCSKSVNYDNAVFIQLERLKFMFFLLYSLITQTAFQHVMFAYPLQVLKFAVVYFMHQSFVSTAPPSPTGIAVLRQLLFNCPCSAGEITGGFTLGILPL